MKVTDKFEFYDILGIVVPGVLLSYIFILCFPGVIALAPKMSDGVNTIVFSALAVFMGQLVQALASLVEPLLFRSWKGKPSMLALTIGLGERYWSAAEAMRVRTKLESINGSEQSIDSLFRSAMHRAEKANSPRVTKFNALYAYHRGLVVLLLVTVIVLAVSCLCGALASIPKWHVVWLCVPVVASLVLIWHRTRQRAFYYVREVLLVAEGFIDTSQAPRS